MFINNPNLKIFSSNDWMKVTDISLIEYTVDAKTKDGKTIPLIDKTTNKPITYTKWDWTIIWKNEQESKWFRLKFEFTDDKWNTKKIIYLQEKEILDFLAVLYWLKKSAEFMRNNPIKKLSIENQWTHSFLRYNQENKQYYAKVDTFSWFNISTLGLWVILKESKRTLKIPLSFQDVISQIKLIYWDSAINIQANQKEESKSIDYSTTSFSDNNNSNWNDLIPCSECDFKLNPIKHSKVIDFSKKKYNKVLCYNCQQKQ